MQGSGWSVLAWEPLGQRLVLEQVYDHQGNLSAGMVPLLLLDMWEPAFYLQYRTAKPDYVEAWWNVVNWADVTRRFRPRPGHRAAPVSTVRATMNIDGPDQLLQTVLPPALEVLTAWSIAETEADPSVFRHAMNRALGDAAQTPDPRRGLAEMMFGL